MGKRDADFLIASQREFKVGLDRTGSYLEEMNPDVSGKTGKIAESRRNVSQRGFLKEGREKILRNYILRMCGLAGHKACE